MAQTQAQDLLQRNPTVDGSFKRRFLALSIEKGSFWDNMSEEHVYGRNEVCDENAQVH
ncbi:MAG: hypothetical protein WCA89_11015 [Terracidiphilus sp.]|jgi:hypothetical protein